jgi:CheY-like chemotaxis protein
MPIMDGIQLLEALKKHPTHDRPPVILLTADMSIELRRQALELGAYYAVIDKLIAFQELAVLSARAIEGREVDRSGLSETRDD